MLLSAFEQRCLCAWEKTKLNMKQHTEHIDSVVAYPSIFCTLAGGGAERVEGGSGLLKLPHAIQIQKSL